MAEKEREKKRYWFNVKFVYQCLNTMNIIIVLGL